MTWSYVACRSGSGSGQGVSGLVRLVHVAARPARQPHIPAHSAQVGQPYDDHGAGRWEVTAVPALPWSMNSSPAACVATIMATVIQNYWGLTPMLATQSVASRSARSMRGIGK